MIIKNYEYITHKICSRAWGIECRFTVAKLDGSHINDIVMVADGKESDEVLAAAILSRLILTDVPREEIVPEATYTETQVKELLVTKGYLKTTETIEELKTATELIAFAEIKPVVEVIK